MITKDIKIWLFYENTLFTVVGNYKDVYPEQLNVKMLACK